MNLRLAFVDFWEAWIRLQRVSETSDRHVPSSKDGCGFVVRRVDKQIGPVVTL